MKYISFFTLLLLGFLAACTPKAGDKTARTPAENSAKAPVIPIPTGEVRKSAPVAGTAPVLQIGKAETFKLDNGLTVIVVENHKLPQVSYRIFVDNDPELEKDAAGYIDMMGEMLSKGTKTRTKSQIDEAVDFLGASLSTDANGVSGTCLTKHTDKLLELMSDVLLNPSFPQEELDKAKTRAQSALAQQKDDANAIAGNVGSVLRYGKNHPYGEVMTEATLEKINLDQMKAYYGRYFKPNIAYFVVVGDLSKAQAQQFSKKYFGKWTKGEAPSNVYGVPLAPQKTEVDFVHKAGAVQSVINITYPVELRPGEPDVIRSRVMNAVLGGYFNSRLNLNLREGHGYTYGARSSLNPDKLVGSFSATASVRNEVTDSSFFELIKELNRMRAEKIPDTELKMVKSVLTGQFTQSLEQPGTIAGFALSTARFGLPADYYDKYLEVLQSVTAEEVLQMAQKYIHPDRAHFLVVGNKDAVSDDLKPFANSGKINFYDMYGNPDRSSEVSIPAGVTAETVINDYVNAIGGKDKIAAVKELEFTALMKTGGPTFEFKTRQKGGNKVLIEVTMAGQVISRQVYDGVKGVEYGMDGASHPLEGAGLEDVREQAKFCKEAGYIGGSYKMLLTGVEEVNGANAYVIEIERADGKKTTEYYDMKSSLKLREMSVQEGPEGPVPVTNDMMDYKEVNGVLLPHTLLIGGLFPVPMKAEITEIKVNGGIDDTIFKIN